MIQYGELNLVEKDQVLVFLNNFLNKKIFTLFYLKTSLKMQIVYF